MSIGSSLSGISFSGIGSGIDTQSMITRLLAIEARPMTRLQTQKAQLQQLREVKAAFRDRIGAIQTAATAINSAAAFTTVKGTSSKTDVATLSTGAGAQAGTYNLEVTKLAQSHKISTTGQADLTSALNLSGRMMLNGRAITVAASDTLTTLAQKINGSSAGVTASIVNGGAGQAFLSLTSNTSGVDAKIQISDLTGTVASSLGLASGAAAIRQPITNGAASASFAASTTPIGTLLGATGLPSSKITINGTDVSVQLQTQSLQDIANAITTQVAGVTASVKSVTENGATRYRLEITGASTPTFVDPNGTLAALGVLQKGYGNQLSAAQNAEFKLDGISMTNASNTITTVIPGATLTLLKANETTPETSTLTLGQDNDAVKTKLKGFMDAFNNMVDFVKQYSALDKDTFQTGPLFGDATTQGIEATLGSTMFNQVKGLTSNYSNLTQLGFAFGSDGKLKLDEASLDAALNAGPEAVGNVFRVTGSGSVESLEFVSSTSKTIPSGTGAYDVEITQLATKGYNTAGIAQTAVNASSETLTFSGALFGSTNYTMSIAAGNSLQATVDQINNDSKLKDLVVASIDHGYLKIESKKYGSNGNFAVASNLDAASNNSGIGTSGGEIGTPVIYKGVDIAGKINGAVATGSGQFLTGSKAGDAAEGLQILYSGSTLGIVGSVKFSKGVAASVADLVSGFTDSVSGLLLTDDKSLESQVKQIDDTISTLNDRLDRKRLELQRRFTAMESAINSLQQQQSRLSQMLAAKA